VQSGSRSGTTFRSGRDGRYAARSSQSSCGVQVMRLLIDCIRTVSHDTYRSVCRLSYFPYDVEPYIVPTAMAERRKQQGKRDRCVFLQPIVATRRHTIPFMAIVSISLHRSATSRRPFPSCSVMCPIELQTICNRRRFLKQ